MAQLENDRAPGDRPSRRSVQAEHQAPRSGGPIMHRDDPWQDELFDRHPSEFDPQ